MAPGRLATLLSTRGVRWALGGLVVFVVVETLLALAGEKLYVVSVASLIVLVTVGGWAIGHYRSVFDISLRKLTAMTQIGRIGDTDEWVTKWDRTLFRPFAVWPTTFILFVGLLWFSTLLALGPVFDRTWINWAVVAFFVPTVLVGAWGSFIAIGVVWAIRQTANRDFEAPFSVARNPVIGDMERGWRTAGFFILAVYLLLLTAFLTGPHELDRSLTAWLIVFVLFPIAWFVAGSHQLHRMLFVLKRRNLDHAEMDVRKLDETKQRDPSEVTLQEFNAALDIQAKVQAMPEWPSVPGGIAGFVFAAAPLVIQISLVYTGIADSL